MKIDKSHIQRGIELAVWCLAVAFTAWLLSSTIENCKRSEHPENIFEGKVDSIRLEHKRLLNLEDSIHEFEDGL